MDLSPFSPGLLCISIRKWPRNVEKIARFPGGEKSVESCHVCGCHGFFFFFRSLLFSFFFFVRLARLFPKCRRCSTTTRDINLQGRSPVGGPKWTEAKWTSTDENGPFWSHECQNQGEFKGTISKGQTEPDSQFLGDRRSLLIFAFPGIYSIWEVQIFAENRWKPQKPVCPI